MSYLFRALQAIKARLSLVDQLSLEVSRFLISKMLGQTILIGLAATSAANAFQYGYNHVTVRKDIPLVAANFKDVDIDLYSPAFLDPESRQAGFKNGTQGPTSHEDMGMHISEHSDEPTLTMYRVLHGKHCRKE
jgi:hypothetical protein